MLVRAMKLHCAAVSLLGVPHVLPHVLYSISDACQAWQAPTVLQVTYVTCMCAASMMLNAKAFTQWQNAI